MHAHKERSTVCLVTASGTQKPHLAYRCMWPLKSCHLAPVWSDAVLCMVHWAIDVVITALKGVYLVRDYNMALQQRG